MTTPDQNREEYRYFAFISYSHKDAIWAKWLHEKLEKYKVPDKVLSDSTTAGNLVASNKRLFPIFRDQDELPTSADLSNAITEALRKSRCLLVICSPDAAKSRWVDEEIRQYKAMGHANRILAIIVNGEPNADGKQIPLSKECFPRALRYEIASDGTITNRPVEPLAADFRFATLPTDKRTRKTIDNEFLRVAAGVIGVGYDKLFQREYHRRMARLKQQFLAGFVGFILVLALGYWFFGRVSNQVYEVKSNVKEIQQQQQITRQKTQEAEFRNELENKIGNLHLMRRITIIRMGIEPESFQEAVVNATAKKRQAWMDELQPFFDNKEYWEFIESKRERQLDILLPDIAVTLSALYIHDNNFDQAVTVLQKVESICNTYLTYESDEKKHISHDVLPCLITLAYAKSLANPQKEADIIKEFQDTIMHSGVQFDWLRFGSISQRDLYVPESFLLKLRPPVWADFIRLRADFIRLRAELTRLNNNVRKLLYHNPNRILVEMPPSERSRWVSELDSFFKQLSTLRERLSRGYKSELDSFFKQLPTLRERLSRGYESELDSFFKQLPINTFTPRYIEYCQLMSFYVGILIVDNQMDKAEKSLKLIEKDAREVLLTSLKGVKSLRDGSLTRVYFPNDAFNLLVQLAYIEGIKNKNNLSEFLIETLNLYYEQNAGIPKSLDRVLGVPQDFGKNILSEAQQKREKIQQIILPLLVL